MKEFVDGNTKVQKTGTLSPFVGAQRVTDRLVLVPADSETWCWYSNDESAYERYDLTFECMKDAVRHVQEFGYAVYCFDTKKELLAWFADSV